ncbi:MAG: hypothetical protein K2O70_09075 [Desulfovibrionaceae bacterium]|nr:hypothetical protein [Desulfovibrionaceae bacterium]
MDVESLVISLGFDPKNFQAGLARLENRFSAFVKGLAAMAAPLLASMSVGAMVNRYMGDVAQVAQMTGRWTAQQEEWIKKRELLSRINREDIELYRKGKLALLNFDAAMAGLSTTIMRRLSPVIKGGIDRLNAVSDWVRKNENNIIRFVTVLAGTITAVLTPAFVRMGIAMLTNPLTWIIAGILLLAIVIDDLVVYIRGGETAFGEFWAQFGSGEEILAKLQTLWKQFRDVLRSLIPYLKRFGNALPDGLSALKPYIPNLLGVAGAAVALVVAFKTWGIIRGLVMGVAGAFRVLTEAVMGNPLVALIMLVVGLTGWAAPYIIEHWDKITAAFGKAADWILEKWEGVKTFFAELWDGIAEKAKKAITTVKGAWSTVKGLFGAGDEDDAAKAGESKHGQARETPPANASSPLGRAWARQTPPASPSALPPLRIPEGAVPTGPQLTQAAIPATLTANNDNRRNVKVDAQFHTTIHAPGADADALAGQFASAMKPNAQKLGYMAAEGGVVQ